MRQNRIANIGPYHWCPASLYSSRSSKRCLLSAVAAAVLCCTQSFAQTEIRVDQALGTNTSSTTGTEGDPFKSISFALATLDSQGAAEPWAITVLPGTYDSNPDTFPDSEIFPIELRTGMTLTGTNAQDVVISGVVRPNKDLLATRRPSSTPLTILPH